MSSRYYYPQLRDFLLFLEILLFLKISSSKTTSCMNQLIPRINANWETYVIYFHSQNNKCQPDDFTYSRIVTFSNESIPKRGSYRYSDTFNIIIVPMEKYSFDMASFSETIVPIRSMFVFTFAKPFEMIDKNTLLLWNHPKISTLKILISLSPNHAEKMLMFQ